jgi:hypothetical protein
MGHYSMSDAARRARWNNLSRSRLRSDWESQVIKILIWQSYFEGGPGPSQRVLARQLDVYPSYISKVQKQSARGLDALARTGRVTLNDLNKARRFTARLREQESTAISLIRNTLKFPIASQLNPFPLTFYKV